MPLWQWWRCLCDNDDDVFLWQWWRWLCDIDDDADDLLPQRLVPWQPWLWGPSVALQGFGRWLSCSAGDSDWAPSITLYHIISHQIRSNATTLMFVRPIAALMCLFGSCVRHTLHLLLLLCNYYVPAMQNKAEQPSNPKLDLARTHKPSQTISNSSKQFNKFQMDTFRTTEIFRPFTLGRECIERNRFSLLDAMGDKPKSFHFFFKMHYFFCIEEK